MDPCEAILETLIKKGWSFRDPKEIKTLIRSNISPESTESELLNMDLRSIGAKSLPDSTSLKKSSHFLGPKILQLVSLRDIYLSRIDASFKNSQCHQRLLRFVLTDGYSEVIAVEYSPIPSVNEEIAPGTKICLENKVVVRSGILCLNPKVVTIMGGIVSSLYEEWQMSQKYSGFSRSLRPSQKENGVGPPPFEKLQIESHRHQITQQQDSHGVLESTSKYPSHKIDSRQAGRNQGYQIVDKGSKADKPVDDAKVDRSIDDQNMESSSEKTEDKPCSSEARPKEVSEAVPVQNQAASQKLLQKMNQPLQGDRNFRGHNKNRFKGKQEEAQVFTLEEWERRKGDNLKPTMASHTLDISRDEELARQLQNQLDLEDFHCLQGKPNYTEAEQIRISMFSFGGSQESRDDGGRGFRGRGRGRGRERGWRGRGRFS